MQSGTEKNADMPPSTLNMAWRGGPHYLQLLYPRRIIPQYKCNLKSDRLCYKSYFVMSYSQS